MQWKGSFSNLNCNITWNLLRKNPVRKKSKVPPLRNSRSIQEKCKRFSLGKIWSIPFSSSLQGRRKKLLLLCRRHVGSSRCRFIFFLITVRHGRDRFIIHCNFYVVRLMMKHKNVRKDFNQFGFIFFVFISSFFLTFFRNGGEQWTVFFKFILNDTEQIIR